MSPSTLENRSRKRTKESRNNGRSKRQQRKTHLQRPQVVLGSLGPVHAAEVAASRRRRCRRCRRHRRRRRRPRRSFAAVISAAALRNHLEQRGHSRLLLRREVRPDVVQQALRVEGVAARKHVELGKVEVRGGSWPF